jgi:hypothetical protein
MKTCKNCGKEIKEKNTYCSLTCRNVYVNKNLRDYSKIGKSLKKNSIEKYLQNPKKCKKCENFIDYDNRINLYCSKDCSKTTINQTNREGLKYKMSDQGRENIIESNLSRLGDEYINYMENPNRCIHCELVLVFKKRKNKYCTNDCRRKNERELMTEYHKYKIDCKFNFNLSKFPLEFDFTLIEKYGWYKPKNRGDNLGGVSRDHIYSVNEGFKNNVNPKIISHPANCRLMIHTDNISKNKKSDILMEDLLKKIEDWNKKY